jgi:hypothetical protein
LKKHSRSSVPVRNSDTEHDYRRPERRYCLVKTA